MKPSINALQPSWQQQAFPGLNWHGWVVGELVQHVSGRLYRIYQLESQADPTKPIMVTGIGYDNNDTIYSPELYFSHFDQDNHTITMNNERKYHVKVTRPYTGWTTPLHVAVTVYKPGLVITTLGEPLVEVDDPLTTNRMRRCDKCRMLYEYSHHEDGIISYTCEQCEEVEFILEAS